MGLGPSGSTTFLVEDPGSTGGGSPPSLWYSGWSETTEITTSARDATRRPGAGDRRPKTNIRLRSLDGKWTDLGSGISRGIVHEGLSLGANRSGPTDAGFSLRRDGTRSYPDLAAFTDMQVSVGGLLVWGGRIDSAPGEATSLSVAAKGRQYDLDFDLVRQSFVHSRLGDYRTQASLLSANLATYRANGQVTNDSGAIVLTFPNGAAYGGGDRCGVTLDTGDVSLGPKRIVVTYESSNNSASDIYFFARSHDTESEAGAGSFNDAISSVVLNTLGASGTIAGTFTNRYRYLTLFILNNAGSPGTYGADHWVKLKQVQVFTETAYESGNHSILKASDVVKVARAGAPGLSTSNARISDSGLIDGGTAGIPHLVSDGYATPRSLMEAANAYHNWALGVDALGRVIFEPRSLTPLYAVGAWRGSELSGLSSGTSDDVYNKVIVEGQDGAGNAISVVRTASAPALDRRGLTRAAKVTVGAVSTTAILELIGDVWLAEKSRTPFRGTLTIGMGGARRIPGGTAAHPAELLLHGGRRIRFMSLVDPDTGGLGRDGVIASVRYDDDATKATVQIDNDYSVLETLLTRFGVLQEQTVA